MFYTKQNIYRDDVAILMGDAFPLPMINIYTPPSPNVLLIFCANPIGFSIDAEILDIVKGHFPDRVLEFSPDYAAISKRVEDMIQPAQSLSHFTSLDFSGMVGSRSKQNGYIHKSGKEIVKRALTRKQHYTSRLAPSTNRNGKLSKPCER